MPYDARAIRAFFDKLAENEWGRLERNVQRRVDSAVHHHLLASYLRAGMSVLDAGCGPGRFAIEMVRQGATVTLVDLSEVQLDLARKHLAEADALGQVSGFHRTDLLDLGSFPERSFDAVVCFGGGVSYTREHYRQALQQLSRVARAGSPVLVSVMSLYGVLRLVGPLDDASFLERPDDHLDWQAVISGSGVVYTNPASREFHLPLVLFTAEGLRHAMQEANLTVETIASSNPLVTEFLPIPRISESAPASAALTALEVALCQQPGLLDTGGHLLAVGRKGS